MITLTLPWPPSVNRYWRNVGGRSIISKHGRQYTIDVTAIVLTEHARRYLAGPIAVSIAAYPPDLHRRDIDNICKAPLDAMCKAGVYQDDSQIEKLTIERRTVRKLGQLVVQIEKL